METETTSKKQTKQKKDTTRNAKSFQDKVCGDFLILLVLQSRQLCGTNNFTSHFLFF